MSENIELRNVVENDGATRPNYNSIEVEPSQSEPTQNEPYQVQPEEYEDHGVIKEPLLKLWQLIGFFRRVFIYFVVVIIADQGLLYLPQWGRVIFKCLPVITLCVFIFRQFNSFKRLWKNKFAFLIFLGMNFSYVADAVLVFQNNNVAFFIAGIVFFIISHVLYTFAFGWTPFESRMFVRAMIAAGLFYYYLYTGNLEGLGLQIGVGIYAVVIMVMLWRSWARVSYYDLKTGRWYEFIGALGASFFVLSDSILSINKFRFPIAGADYSIIATYYIGQLLIALAVVDGPSFQYPQEVAERQSRLERFKASLGHPWSCLKESTTRLFDWLFS